jgi:hypothetical protein
MREKDAGVWKNKMDWIAKKGGMALLNTHPDYMNFYSRKCLVEEYPASYYVEFLNHINQEYETNHWHCLPRDLTAFVCRSRAGDWNATGNQQRRMCSIGS